MAALVGSALFYVLYSHWFSWYLLVLLLLVIPFDLALSLPGMFTKRITVTAPNVLQQGGDGTLVITTIKKEPFPARCIKLKLSISRDDIVKQRRTVCGAEGGSRYEIVIDTSHSGMAVFAVKRIWIVSLIGLFSIPATVSCRAAVLVLPAPLKPANIVALSRGVILRPKPGGGFSEDYDLRHYRPGDPIRSIHWKVSAKFDSLIIREPLVPPLHSRLVHIAKWGNAHERNMILGRLQWISNYLLKWELPYFIRLGDDGTVAEINDADALTYYLYHVLDGKAQMLPRPAYIPLRFTWVFRVDAKK